MNWAKIGLFAGGALFGSAGIEILTSKDAKKLYTQCTAAVLRMKDQVMKTATTLQAVSYTHLCRILMLLFVQLSHCLHPPRIL